MAPFNIDIRHEYRRLRFLLFATYALMSAGTVTVAGWYLYTGYRATVQVAQARSSTLTRALEEHMLGTFTAIDIQLRASARRLLETRALQRPSTPAMVEVLRQEAMQPGFLRSIYVYDASGRGHTTSLGADISRLRASEFEHLQEAQKSATDRLVVGRVIKGAVTGRPSIPLAHAIRNGDGRLVGIIGTSLEPAYFERFYKGLNLESGSSLVLLRSDGAVLVRFPEDPGRPADFSGTPLLREMMAESTAGTADLVSPSDGARRLLTYRHVPGWNLIVANGQLYATVIAPWWRIVWAVGSFVSVSLVIFFMLLRCVLLELVQRSDGERILRDSERRYRELLEQAADAITEQKNTQEALQRSEAWLKETRTLARIGSWELNRVSNSLYWCDETYFPQVEATIWREFPT